jgi:hypothetical protein
MWQILKRNDMYRGFVKRQDGRVLNGFVGMEIRISGGFL